MRLYGGVVPMDGLGRIALQQRDNRPDIANPGMITTFGGRAEPGEDPAAAAIREAAEELGLLLARGSLIDLIDHEKRGAGEPPTRCVIFRVDVGDVGRLQTNEGTGVVTGTPEFLLGRAQLTDTCRRAVSAVRASVRQP